MARYNKLSQRDCTNERAMRAPMENAKGKRQRCQAATHQPCPPGKVKYTHSPAPIKTP